MAPEVIQNSEGYNEKVIICAFANLLFVMLFYLILCLNAGRYLVFGYNCYRNGKR
jgi:hypothetical protein